MVLIVLTVRNKCLGTKKNTHTHMVLIVLAVETSV